jgi:hypothetical protein
MRRFPLAIGILLILAGLLTINQGTDVVRPLAETFGLASHLKSETVLKAPTLLTVAPGNFTFLAVDLTGEIQVSGSVEVAGGGDVGFYVMNEGNFSSWRAGRPSVIVIAKPSAGFYNFSFTPNIDGTYYFVFDNQAGTGRREVVFALNSAKDVIVLNPAVEYLGFELLAIGTLLAVLGIRTGKRKLEPKAVPVETWTCRFCGTENALDRMFCRKCERSRA